MLQLSSQYKLRGRNYSLVLNLQVSEIPDPETLWLLRKGKQPSKSLAILFTRAYFIFEIDLMKMVCC